MLAPRLFATVKKNDYYLILKLVFLFYFKMLLATKQNYLILNSPLEQFEVTSLIGLNAPIFGYFNLTLTKNYYFFIKKRKLNFKFFYKSKL